MQTRSSIAVQILEQRQKKRSARSERELQQLLDAAGIDRPDVNEFANSILRTRQKTKELTRLPPFSSSIEVVIESRHISRRPGCLSGAERETQKDNITKTEFVQNKSQATRTASSAESEQVEDQSPAEDFGTSNLHSNFCSTAAESRPYTKQSPAIADSLTRQGLPGAGSKRRQLGAVRKAIGLERRKKPRKSRSKLLDGLEKALEKLESAPEISPNTLLKFSETQFPASGGLTKPLKKVKLVPRHLLDISLKHRSKHFTISVGPTLSASRYSKRGARKTLPISLKLERDSEHDLQGAERESPSSTSQTRIPETLPAPDSISHILVPHNNKSIMGTSRKASKRANPPKATEAFQGNEMSVERHAIHETSPQDDAMTEAAEYQDEELPQTTFLLTDECKHYTKVSQVDWDIQKYWHQRKSIFSLYDEGIYMTDDAWFGVTPEPVANKVAEDFATFCDPSKTIIIDMFAGAGGNTIAFALSGRWSKVIGIEKDPSVIACAQHNAAIYGVAEQITFVNEDSFSYLTANSSSIDVSNTVIFASPPWGGPGYRSDEVFNLNTMAPYSIKQIHSVCREMDSALYLPRTSDLRQIARLAPEGKKIEIVQYCMEGASKALTAYIPAASSSPRS